MIPFQKHFRDMLGSITPITLMFGYGQNLGKSFKCLTREIFGKASLKLVYTALNNKQTECMVYLM